MNRAVFSSASQHWSTPRLLYDELNAEFDFNFDPCPFGDTSGGLIFESWRGRRVFCNPPYGPEIDSWLRRQSEAELAVYLLPARTDTRWFHSQVLPLASEIRFLRGRLKFGDAINSAPFPSMVPIFDHRKAA